MGVFAAAPTRRCKAPNHPSFDRHSAASKMLSSLARPLRAACPSLPSSSHTGPTTIIKRTAVCIAPPVVFSRKPVRIYSERKQYKVNEYTRLLDNCTKHPVIFFSQDSFEVKRLLQLRKDVSTVALRHVAQPPPSLAAPKPKKAKETPAPPALPEFRIINSSYFGVALRNHPNIDAATRQEIADMLHVEGGLAVLIFPELNPPQLNAILKVLARTVPPRKPKTQAEMDAEARERESLFVPGRRTKMPKPTPVPELKVVGSIIEGRAIRADAVANVAQLPTLDVLRAQIVGLLSAPGSQLAAVLNEAGGAKLSRTLEGLKKSLEEG